jgi:uncharacterized delta-60 repeat protein
VLLKAGSLDPTFGTAGKVLTSLNGTLDAPVSAAAFQTDGKLDVAGRVTNSTTGNDFLVLRYGTDGRLDPTFGTGGEVVTDFDGQDDRATGVVVQADGKIVAAGSSFTNTQQGSFALARYNADGSLDTSFGNGGKVRTTVPFTDEEATGLVLQPDQKLIVVGSSTEFVGLTGGTAFAAARYNTNGTLDTSFGAGGLVKTVVGLSNSIRTGKAALDPEGRLVVTVSSFVGSYAGFTLLRYDASGSLDTSFGSGGVVTTDFGTTAMANAVAFQSDGALVVAGVVNTFTVARYTPAGVLDTTFGQGGLTYVFDSTDAGSVANQILVQADGKLLAAGTFNADIALARLNPDGTLDRTFGSGGTVDTYFRDALARAADVLLQPSTGRLVAVGAAEYSAFTPQASFRNDVALARYNLDGGLVTTFGTAAAVTTTLLGPGASPAADVALQPDGKLLAVGSVGSPGFEHFAVARYNSDDSLDTSFGTGGRVVTDFGGGDVANAVAVQPNGQIVVVGGDCRTSLTVNWTPGWCAKTPTAVSTRASAREER